MAGNAFAVQDSGHDPFAQVWADLESILGELREQGAPPEQALDTAQNAFASMQAGQASGGGFQAGAENENVHYNTDQDTAPVMAMKPIEPERAAALVGVNSATMGMLPYAVAGIKKMTGHDGGRDFETVRREEQNRVGAARDVLGEEGAMATELAAPAGGLGLLARGAKTVGQAAKRGAAAGGIYGTVRGYADPIDPDSTDFGERLAPALMGGAMGAVTGGAGAGAVKKGIDVATAPRAAKPAPKPQRPPRVDPDAEGMAIERGRIAAIGDNPRQARQEGAPLRKIEDLTPEMQDQLVREKIHFDGKYGENSKEWRAHVKQAIGDRERGRRIRAERPPSETIQYPDVKAKLSDITAMYQAGMSISDIGRAIGETGEQVAQTIARAPQTMGAGSWRINSTIDMSDMSPITRGAAALAHANQRTQVVTKPQVRAMLAEADNVLNDVKAYRASEIKSRASMSKPSPDPEAEAMPAAAARPALAPPAAQPAAEQIEAPKPAASRPRSLRGDAAKPKAEAKKKAEPKPKAAKAAKPKAERGLTGTRPARSPRGETASEDPVYSREVKDLSAGQRAAAAEEYLQVLYERGEAGKPVGKMTDRELALGWRRLESQRGNVRAMARGKIRKDE